MDPTPFTSQAPPPFSSSSSPSTSNFRIPVAIAVGFAATSIVLVAYYVVVVKFWLNSRQPNRQNHHPPPIFFTEDDERRGVEQSIIRSIPIVKFTNVEEYVDKEKRSFHECAICLIEFRKGESLKLLPSCRHAFHIDCIDTWLQNNGNCPMCRTSITSPCTTPLVDSSNNNNNYVGCDNTIQSSQTLEIISGETMIEEREYIGRSGQTLSGEQQHIRRSFSMDFFHDRKLTSQASDSNNNGGGGGDGDGGSGRFRRLFHSFALGRSSRSAVLPIRIDE